MRACAGSNIQRAGTWRTGILCIQPRERDCRCGSEDRRAQGKWEANVAYAHGQMKETELENIMYKFINGEIDVLVSTTIIETGLDISNVTTMIIHDADNMGLSQPISLRTRGTLKPDSVCVFNV